MNIELHHECADLLFTEARHIDRREWDEWLALYDENAEYWVPAWDSSYEYTQDPDREVSLIYYSDRSGLEDRIFRIRTNMSSASVPLPRTSHVISNVQVRPQGDDYLVYSNFEVTSFRDKTSSVFAGYYEHVLQRTDAGLRIAKKKIIVINDVIHQLMDVYMV